MQKAVVLRLLFLFMILVGYHFSPSPVFGGNKKSPSDYIRKLSILANGAIFLGEKLGGNKNVPQIISENNHHSEKGESTVESSWSRRSYWTLKILKSRSYVVKVRPKRKMQRFYIFELSNDPAPPRISATTRPIYNLQMSFHGSGEVMEGNVILPS